MTFTTRAFGLVFALALAGAAPQAQAATWTMNPEASTLSFAGTQTGTEFRGQFRSFAAEIAFDPEDLSTASISATIDIVSFASGSPDRDSDALNMSWFYAANFPQATFSATDVVAGEDGGYVARGTLEIKGISREVDLPFTLTINGDTAVADGALTLNRLDYAVGNMDEDVEEELVGHTVTVLVHIEATRAD